MGSWVPTVILFLGRKQMEFPEFVGLRNLTHTHGIHKCPFSGNKWSSTPEHCLVSGGVPLVWWKKQHVSIGQNGFILRSPVDFSTKRPNQGHLWHPKAPGFNGFREKVDMPKLTFRSNCRFARRGGWSQDFRRESRTNPNHLGL